VRSDQPLFTWHPVRVRGCDYAQAPGDVLPVYLRAIDHVFGQNDGRKRLRTLVKELSTAFALAVPRPETGDITPHLAFFPGRSATH